jgi:hypothetical protein
MRAFARRPVKRCATAPVRAASLAPGAGRVALMGLTD